LREFLAHDLITSPSFIVVKAARSGGEPYSTTQIGKNSAWNLVASSAASSTARIHASDPSTAARIRFMPASHPGYRRRRTPLTDCAKDRIDLDQSVLSFSMSQSSGSATTSSEASTMATTDAAPPIDLRNLV
jgi:hypothetical protein